jgi:hypothetical protein
MLEYMGREGEERHASINEEAWQEAVRSGRVATSSSGLSDFE